MSTPADAVKTLGVAACTAIVVGNMVGSGFYLSPSAVAPYGLLAIVAWIVMGAGAVCLGLTFARLARMTPATGGPYAYTRAGYGDFAGFLVAWGYWISIWASLPVIAVAFTGSLLKLMPQLQSNRPVGVTVTLGAIWLVTLLNLRGVKEAGIFAEVTTYAKLVPFTAIALVGLFFVKWHTLGEFNPSGKSLLESGAALAPLTMFAYLGLESATVPAGDVRDPERTIPRSTMIGILIAGLLYVLGTTVVMGVVPREQLVASGAPFADAARLMWGSWAADVVALAVMVSSLGALNGWTLMMGQVPMAAAADRVFPVVFGRLSPRGVPAVGLAISASLATALVLVEVSGGAKFSAIYNMIVSLSTMAAVIPYVFCSLAPGLIASRTGAAAPRITPVEIIAFMFAMFTVYGCGPEPVLYGLILLLLGLPVYVWQRRERMSAGPAMTGVLTVCLLAAWATSARAAEADPAKDDKSITVTIYPIMVKAPIFGASVDLPRIPGGGGGGGGDEGGALSGATDVSLNAAYMGGVLIEGDRWFAEAFGTWAALSANRATPRIQIDSNTYLYTARGGVRLFSGLSATAGVRRATIDLDASLTLPISDNTIRGRTKPGLWDPLVGADWRGSLGRWRLEGNVQGGGFGVGADVDVSAEGRARWRAKHFEFCLGYGFNYFKLTVADFSIGSFQRTLVARQTLHGPEIGLGIFF